MRAGSLTAFYLMLVAAVGAGAAPAEAAMTRSSAEALMASGKSLSCDFESQEDGGTSKGTVFISSGKMRGNFIVADPSAGSFTAHMIQKDGWAYTWGGPMGAAQGTKMRVNAAGPGMPSKKGFDSGKEVDMDCREWRADEAYFSPPSGVEFTDLSASLAAAQSPMGNMQEMKCQACESMPAGPDRDMCKQMMGC